MINQMAKKCYFCDSLQATRYFVKNNNKQASHEVTIRGVRKN